ncbi:expressed unknown protein [Seminavis robusta]|uniref:Uncharacterized protein n=1 Tax=Seminavis robusta TaxID=568900 RepID=A0A9N8HLZ7_9STRA|nr:expressed unknown protein [Seminavis robusta]|eukprot:Sro1071_g237940.1 n/a (811) ;mRNA; r:19144-21576
MDGSSESSESSSATSQRLDGNSGKNVSPLIHSRQELLEAEGATRRQQAIDEEEILRSKEENQRNINQQKEQTPQIQDDGTEDKDDQPASDASEASEASRREEGIANVSERGEETASAASAEPSKQEEDDEASGSAEQAMAVTPPDPPTACNSSRRSSLLTIPSVIDPNTEYNVILRKPRLPMRAHIGSATKNHTKNPPEEHPTQTENQQPDQRHTEDHQKTEHQAEDRKCLLRIPSVGDPNTEYRIVLRKPPIITWTRNLSMLVKRSNTSVRRGTLSSLKEGQEEDEELEYQYYNNDSDSDQEEDENETLRNISQRLSELDGDELQPIVSLFQDYGEHFDYSEDEDDSSSDGEYFINDYAPMGLVSAASKSGDMNSQNGDFADNRTVISLEHRLAEMEQDDEDVQQQRDSNALAAGVLGTSSEKSTRHLHQIEVDFADDLNGITKDLETAFDSFGGGGGGGGGGGQDNNNASFAGVSNVRPSIVFAANSLLRQLSLLGKMDTSSSQDNNTPTSLLDDSSFLRRDSESTVASAALAVFMATTATTNVKDTPGNRNPKTTKYPNDNHDTKASFLRRDSESTVASAALAVFVATTATTNVKDTPGNHDPKTTKSPNDNDNHNHDTKARDGGVVDDSSTTSAGSTGQTQHVLKPESPTSVEKFPFTNLANTNKEISRVSLESDTTATTNTTTTEASTLTSDATITDTQQTPESLVTTSNRNKFLETEAPIVQHDDDDHEMNMISSQQRQSLDDCRYNQKDNNMHGHGIGNALQEPLPIYEGNHRSSSWLDGFYNAVRDIRESGRHSQSARLSTA